MTEAPMLTEVWWRCPRCGADGGFCGYEQGAIDVLFGLCIPTPGAQDNLIRVHGYSMPSDVSCWSCGWQGSWKEAGCGRSPEDFW